MSIQNSDVEPGPHSVATHRALAHPTRHRLLMALRQDPATISQLARRLGTRKGNVAHHLKILTDAQLVRWSLSKQVRGGTERYYEVVPGPIIVTGDDPLSTVALLQAVATEITAATDPLLHVRHIRLSMAQADEIRDALAEIVARTPPADDDEPTYGIVVGLYNASHPEPTPFSPQSP